MDQQEPPEDFEPSGPVLITREHAIAAARNALRNQGYALAVHGTQIRDLDLLAVPWRATALDAEAVAEIVAHAIPAVLHKDPGTGSVVWERKPHGRMATSMYPRWAYGFDRWYVDLSVMPRFDDVVERLHDGTFGEEDGPRRVRRFKRNIDGGLEELNDPAGTWGGS